MSKIDEINGIDSFNSCSSFFKKNDLKKLSDDEIEKLSIQVAELNSKYELYAYFANVQNEQQRRSSKFSSKIAWIALAFSAMSALYTAITYHFPKK